jgi:hypothetical protein
MLVSRATSVGQGKHDQVEGEAAHEELFVGSKRPVGDDDLGYLGYSSPQPSRFSQRPSRLALGSRCTLGKAGADNDSRTLVVRRNVDRPRRVASMKGCAFHFARRRCVRGARATGTFDACFCGCARFERVFPGR